MCIPHLADGGSVSLISSVGGLRGFPNMAHYVAAKHGPVGLMRTLALELAPRRIRVDTVHPTQVDTATLDNPMTYDLFLPDADHPTKADFAPLSQALNLLPVPWLDPVDVSNVLLFLASDEGRHLTGVALPVDAGSSVR